MNNTEHSILAFLQSNQFVESELKKVEKNLGLYLRDNSASKRNDLAKYYSHFEEGVINEARHMGIIYEVFYCLEKFIRQIIIDTLEGEFGDTWWNTQIPDHVKQEITKRIKNEQDLGLTPRSIENIEFATFGELSAIIEHNWSILGSIFLNKAALKKLMHLFNALRNYIAHCAPMPDHEFQRFQLHLNDFFRLLGGADSTGSNQEKSC